MEKGKSVNMTTTSIRGIFKKEYNGAPNFMTPEVVSYGKKGKLIYELSRGPGMCGGDMYGVTVIELDNETKSRFVKKRHEDVDGCFVTNSDIEAWKQGKKRLWLTNYTGYLEQVNKRAWNVHRKVA